MISVKNSPKYLMLAYGCQGIFFLLPILVLFYQDKGVSVGNFFFIQGLCSVMIFFSEIPTGYLGDLFSRKNVLILSFLMWILGYLFWIFGYGFWFMLGGELLFGLAIALISGTGEAYLYDLLKKNNKQNLFHLKISKMFMIQNIFLTISTFSGVFLFQFLGADILLWITIAFLFLGVFILLLLPDVPESKRKVPLEKTKFQDILCISKRTLCNPEIKSIILFSSIYGTMTFILLWGMQLVMQEAKIPLYFFAFVTGIGAFFRTVYSWIGGRLIEKWKFKKNISFLIFLILLGYLSTNLSFVVPYSWVYICLAGMLISCASVQMMGIFSSTFVNHRTQSDERSTVLSVKSMIERFFVGGIFISLKPLIDIFGIQNMFLGVSIIFLPIIIVIGGNLICQNFSEKS